VAIDHSETRAPAARSKGLAQLLGIRVDEAADLSLSARLRIIARLKAARRVEIARGRSGSWLYDVNRHLNLCAALRQEYEALADYFADGAAQNCRRRPARAGARP